VEAARVQWATSEMGAMWQEYPEPLQLALLGLLAARLRHLEERISLDVGPKMALERLRSYRVTLGLDSVPGLMPNRRPEYASWAVDAMHWWAALEDGLRPLLDGEVSQ